MAFRSTCMALVMLTPACVPAHAAAPPAAEPCVECHGEDGMGQGRPMVPIIAGMPAAHIEEAIYAYIDGARRCVREPRMCETVERLDEAGVAIVADHYAAQVRRASAAPFDAALAAEGGDLHRDLCSICHLRPDDPGVGDALGIPLHGQRPEYLRFALEAYREGYRTELLPAMEERIDALAPGDLDALVNYYASYRPD